MHLLAPEVGILGTVPIVAGTVPLAAGAAQAYKLRKGADRQVAVAFLGDGAVEEGHVHETLNLAALYRLPMVFVCENNLYASHLHWSERRAFDHIHRAGEFHGVPGESLDGNDIAAVWRAGRRAIERARLGGGPAWIECRTFRFRGHVGPSADLDVGLKRRGELSEWLRFDPIRCCEDVLGAVAAADSWGHEAARVTAEIDSEIDLALASARAAQFPAPSRYRDHVFAAREAAGVDAEPGMAAACAH
jgi:pyruvate dehydrogenase E1 component alpha subunit